MNFLKRFGVEFLFKRVFVSSKKQDCNVKNLGPGLYKNIQHNWSKLIMKTFNKPTRYLGKLWCLQHQHKICFRIQHRAGVAPTVVLIFESSDDIETLVRPLQVIMIFPASQPGLIKKSLIATENIEPGVKIKYSSSEGVWLTSKCTVTTKDIQRQT